MQGPAQLDLALDVHHLSGAHPHLGSDPAGSPEAEVAELDHRESVHLTDLSTLRVDQYGLADDLLLNTLSDAIGAVDLGIQSALHIFAGYHLASGLPGPVVGFAQQIGDDVHLHRELPTVPHQPGAVLNNPGDCAPVERPELVHLRQAGDQTGVEILVAAIAIHLVIEIRGHPKQLTEVRVDFGQQIVDQRLSDQGHLHVQGDGLWIQ